MILQGFKENFPSDFVFYKDITKTYPNPYISMTRIGLNFKFTWKNLIRYKIYFMLINETPSPLLEGVSHSPQITDLGSLLKYILY
ncbi:hypothetical protein CBO05C_2371 [Clostridium botulinum B str. Osaka05]|uniref:Uncharacterized protein n=1 Tax=Clostridium botulinum B str. Osaka05 TaxID=1407017 RepID=A0A0S6U5F9_CLOBO|nr:hypothetical protein CBO05C_2371 [Clostridium botulinum B str. Osaka05]